MLLLLACRRDDPLPSTAEVATWTEMWADARAPRAPGDGGGALAWVQAPEVVQASSVVDLSLALTVGPEGIDEGGAISFLPSPFWGWTPPQALADGAPGFTSFHGPDGVHFEVLTRDGQIQALVRGRALAPGEQVAIAYTEARVDAFAEARSALWVGVDADGDGIRALVPDPPTLRIVAGEPAALIVTLPSVAAPGETVVLRIAAVDRVGNAFRGVSGPVTLRGDGLTLPPSVELDVEGLAAVPVEVRSEGIWQVEAVGPGIVGASNVLVAREGAVPIRWADLQVHGAGSDGTGEAADLYRYGREVAGLDGVAVTEHDHWGMTFLDRDPEAQEALARAAEAAYAPGRFVTVPGYEWTSWAHGHRHVLWFDRPGTWVSSLSEAGDTPTELHRALAGSGALIVRHHPAGGPVAVDWSFPIDPQLEPVVEIASVHGQSESASLPGRIGQVSGRWIEDVLASGQRFGMIGSTDGHDGHPGLSQLAGGGGGLAALEGADLDRGSFLGVLRARRVYATNGPRIVLRFAVDGAPMGSAVPARTSRVEARVVGSAAIDHVELVSRAGVIGSQRGAGPALHAEWTIEPRAGDLVYLRVVQVDGGLAWSSPVFFD